MLTCFSRNYDSMSEHWWWILIISAGLTWLTYSTICGLTIQHWSNSYGVLSIKVHFNTRSDDFQWPKLERSYYAPSKVVQTRVANDQVFDRLRKTPTTSRLSWTSQSHMLCSLSNTSRYSRAHQKSKSLLSLPSKLLLSCRVLNVNPAQSPFVGFFVSLSGIKDLQCLI